MLTHFSGTIVVIVSQKFPVVSGGSMPVPPPGAGDGYKVKRETNVIVCEDTLAIIGTKLKYKPTATGPSVDLQIKTIISSERAYVLFLDGTKTLKPVFGSDLSFPENTGAIKTGQNSILDNLASLHITGIAR